MMTCTRESLEKAIAHSVNYHGLDARLGKADYRVAELMVDEVVKHLLGTTDAQVFERMTPEQRANIGRNN